MALMDLRKMLRPAYEQKYAVPAFNFWTYDDAAAIIGTAAALRAPVILMASGSCVKYLGAALAADMVEKLSHRAGLPVVLHLDHAETVEECLAAAKAGFTSVMYDGSKLPVEENMENTRFVVRAAHAMGVSVEAEIGRVGRGEEGEDIAQVLTDAEGARDFYEATRVDALAIAAGTMHGMQTQQAQLRFDIVSAVSRAVDVPLVLHGSSGVRNEDLPLLCQSGICKINFGTRLRNVFVEACRAILADQPKLKNHLPMLLEARKAVGEVVRDKILRLGAANRM